MPPCIQELSPSHLFFSMFSGLGIRRERDTIRAQFKEALKHQSGGQKASLAHARGHLFPAKECLSSIILLYDIINAYRRGSNAISDSSGSSVCTTAARNLGAGFFSRWTPAGIIRWTCVLPLAAFARGPLDIWAVFRDQEIGVSPVSTWRRSGHARV